eukprot:CAMPEP_0172761768 /NCGR_PEP_ID=MMETSP1074-20121228/172162_1 /TAXON_ID=2916 /ORGANISM="Ceratium fusus, Strain PA161109" /LENGTH=81 /DNA_ID=CAMNT_0013596043 /DNA_START=86 /DNA_END=328 /DNA_ORIENTATION=+
MQDRGFCFTHDREHTQTVPDLPPLLPDVLGLLRNPPCIMQPVASMSTCVSADGRDNRPFLRRTMRKPSTKQARQASSTIHA